MIRLGRTFTPLRLQRAKFQKVDEKKTEDKKTEEKKAEDTAPKEENKNNNTNTRKIDLSNFFDQNYLLPINFKPIDTKPTPVVTPKDDEPEVDEKDEETPTTNDDEPKNTTDEDKKTILERNAEELRKNYLDALENGGTKTDGVSGNETETKKLTEDEIKAAIKKSAPDITDYQMNQLLTTISSYDNLDSSSIESAVKKLMQNYNNDKNTIIMAANTINADTGESLMQQDFRSIINLYTTAVDKNNSGEKNKPTVEDLNSMFTDYVNTMKEARTVFNPSSIYEGLDIHLQSVIDNNKFDVTLGNLKSFFDDVQKNIPTDGDKEAYLKERFNDFIENGYNPDLSAERTTLKRQSDELYNSLLNAMGGNNGTSTPKADSDFDEKLKKIEEERKAIEEEIKNKQENDDVNGVFNETGDKPSGGVRNTEPTPEELERIRNRINGIVDSTFFDFK